MLTDVVESSEEIGSQPIPEANTEQEVSSDVGESHNVEVEKTESPVVVPVPEVSKSASVMVTDSVKHLSSKPETPAMVVKDGIKAKLGSVGNMEELENLSGLSGENYINTFLL